MDFKKILSSIKAVIATKNFQKIIALVLCVAIVLGCVLTLVLCTKDNGNDTGNQGGNTPGGSVVGGGGSTNDGKTTYTVQVKTVGGMPLEDIKVYVYGGETDDTFAALPQNTNENGIVVFELDTANNYSIQLENVPDGYNVKSGDTKADRYEMGTTGAVITLSSAPITTGGYSSSYEIGDVMYDFTLTDINGERYKLSELLATKRMVMINFWYKDCSNCAYEFPYINAVYEDYTDVLEILAVNDYPSDSIDDVKGYPSYLGEDLKMPLIKVGNTQNDLTLSRFPSEGYPTTVIIDRYGVICMIEVGAVLGENKWKSIFDHFTADNYEQKLIKDASDIIPVIEPTIQWTDTSESEIAGAFNSGDIQVSYHPELSEKDAKYSWPFIVDTFDGKSVVRPSNDGIDNSYSILYAEVKLKPGEAILFDYYSLTQYGSDVLFVLVDGKDIYSISGDSTNEGWSTCCTYVDPRPVLESNKNVEVTYEVAFAYYKDDFDAFSDDTVYLKDLRVIDAQNLDVETYIFRYAATDLNATASGYNEYASVYLASDGYYHVGNKADGSDPENDPFLLANLLSYSQFDPYKTVSERIYAAGSEEGGGAIIIDGVNKFNQWLIYGNAASNSQVAYHTAVTKELKDILVAYCDTYRRDVGKSANENLWLQLCSYYDAYGIVDGVPTPRLENPIKGLTSFSAYDVTINTDATSYTEGQIIATEKVSYNKVIMPKGYLYKFTPTVSGVYRVNSHSEQEVVGWIFTGNSAEWALNGGDRVMLTHYDVGERYNPDLLIGPDENGKYERDFINTSLLAYMEEGKDYYIDIAFYDTYGTGDFTFSIKYVGDNFGQFIQASPGPITYIENMDGGMGQLIAGGIDYIFVEEADGQKYAYHLKGYDENNNPILGSKIYADFYQPTTLFQSQSIEKLVIANAFNFTITETDREALIILDNLKVNGKSAVSAEAWKNLELDEVIRYAWKHATVDENYVITVDLSGSEYTTEQQTVVNSVLAAGMAALKAEWGASFTANWDSYKLTEIINVCLKTGIFHSTDNRTDKDLRALEYLAYIAENPGEQNGRNIALMAYWDAEFDTVVIKPEGNGDNRTASELRYDYFWDYYKMDDVKAGIYHGKVANYTETIEKYVALMEDNGTTNPERQGCVAVTEELAEILLALVDKEVFENVQGGWLKFCYYYEILGVVAE